MKKRWKRIEIDFDKDDNIIHAEIDGVPTKEFNKNAKSKK